MSWSDGKAAPDMNRDVFVTRWRALSWAVQLLFQTDLISDDAFNSPSVKVAEDFVWNAKIPQPPWEVQSLLGFLQKPVSETRWAYILADVCSKQGFHLVNSVSPIWITVCWSFLLLGSLIISLDFSAFRDRLLSWNQATSPATSLLCHLFPISDQPIGWIVICTFHNDGAGLGVHPVISEDRLQE